MMSEEILGAFAAWIDKGGRILKKIWSCNLVFTTNRLIAAEEKRGFWHDWSDLLDPYISFHASARERLKMKEVSPESILKASSENFEIPYPNIVAVDVGGYNNVTKALPFLIFLRTIWMCPSISLTLL